jgi:uracil-DNA glycosylase family 4
MSRIFINYRRQDSEGYVGRVYDHLLQVFDRDSVFMDVDDIKPGMDFVQALEEAVASCDVFLAVIGPLWLANADESGQRRLHRWDDFVRIEIATALSQKKLVIPLLVGGAKMPSPSELPEGIEPLARRNAIEISHQRFKYDMQRLIGAIKDALPANSSFKPPADNETVRRKDAALKAIRAELMNATASPLYPHRVENHLFPVLGDGNPDANIMFIGESPGKYEAAEGRPFVGPSGEVLAQLLDGINLKRADVFITNLLLDTPGAKRDPLPDEIAFYAPFVDRIIDTIQPAVIVTLGRFASEYLLKKLDLPEKRQKISALHGTLIKTQMPYGEIHLVPMYHPAVVLYSASQRETLKKDFEKLKLFV